MPVYSRDAGRSGKFFVDFDFILEEGRIDLYILEFQGDFLSSLEIASLEPVSLSSRRFENFTHLDIPHRMIRRPAGGLTDTCPRYEESILSLDIARWRWLQRARDKYQVTQHITSCQISIGASTKGEERMREGKSYRYKRATVLWRIVQRCRD